MITNDMGSYSLILRYTIPKDKYCLYDMAAVAVDTAGNWSAEAPSATGDNHRHFTRLKLPVNASGFNNSAVSLYTSPSPRD